MNEAQQEQLKDKKEKLQSALRVKAQIHRTITPQWMPLLQELKAKQIAYSIIIAACMEAGDEDALKAQLDTPELAALGFLFEQMLYGKHHDVPFTNKVNAVFSDESRSSRYTPPLPLQSNMYNQPLSVLLPTAKAALGFTDEQLYLCNAYESTVISVGYEGLLQLNLEQYIGLDDWLITTPTIDWLIWLGWRGDCCWGRAKK